MSDENLAPQEREWLANPEATVREALGDTVGDGEGLDGRVFDALIARAKAEAWEEGWNALADAIETCTVAGGEPCGAPVCAICNQDNPYRDETANE